MRPLESIIVDNATRCGITPAENSAEAKRGQHIPYRFADSHSGNRHQSDGRAETAAANLAADCVESPSEATRC